ncbi:MAG: hypothetical protein CFH06_00209 [Alphaproteobacteria bacterium MarineAlpha3_Bin5]|nr:MAG: hypothetical protein CFH06_00209 [Alphaproteobacteria bacterium MarineAlpha3_Bin5]
MALEYTVVGSFGDRFVSFCFCGTAVKHSCVCAPGPVKSLDSRIDGRNRRQLRYGVDFGGCHG